MSHTVLLFDIDGTLLHAGGAGRRAFQRAFHEVVGAAEACAGFSFAGMTDRAIARRGLTASGLADRPDCEVLVGKLVDAYLAALHDELAVTQHYRVIPGAREAVISARGRDGVAVGIGTGNIKGGADAKLTKGGLQGLFDFGGYGCDAEDRAELLRVGAMRGAARLGHPMAACRVIVVGDTVLDVKAALAIGARCLAVATGGSERDELRRAGAHWVFDDLRQEGVTRALVDG